MKQNCTLFIIICLIIFTLNTIIVCNHGTNIFTANLKRVCYVIHEKGAPLGNCFSFIDGTVMEICRPKPIYQGMAYNGHQRAHSIKFLNLALPNSLIGNISGLYEGPRHDSTMLHESCLLNDLQKFAWYNNQPRCIYGDTAYQLSVYLQATCRQSQNNQDMMNYNKVMGQARATVEWLFENIKTILNSLISRKN